MSARPLSRSAFTLAREGWSLFDLNSKIKVRINMANVANQGVYGPDTLMILLKLRATLILLRKKSHKARSH
ncbi:MAG: hypothetical protein Roseis2KO_32590 [Roseivirga sp.]